MERDWERRHAVPTFERACLERIVGEHLGRDDLRSVEPLAGGKINAHLRLSLADGHAVVLRVGLGASEALAKEAALLGHFAGRIPVPELLGRGTIDVEEAPRPYLLMGWVAGETLDDVLATTSDVALARTGQETGAAMACIHTEKRASLGFLDEALQVPEPMGALRDVWAAYLAERMARPLVADRLGRARIEQVAALVRDEGSLLQALDGGMALLHGDCKPTNIRGAEDGTLAALLDWEFAWAGPPLSDWGQMLRWPLPAVFEEGLLAGYAQGGGGEPLKGDGRRQAALLDVLNLVTFLDWQDGTARSRRVVDALALLDATLA